jgi:plasmid stabilization system protein ParE
MTVYWSAEAVDRLRELTAFIEKDSPKAATEVAAKLLQRSSVLAEPPLTGRRLPEFPDSSCVNCWNGPTA